MKPRVSSVLVGVWAVAILALMPRGSRAQGGGGGGGGGGGSDTEELAVTTSDDGGGAPPLVCEADGSSAHYEEFLDGEGSITVRWAGTTTGCPNHVNWPFNPGFTVAAPTNNSIPAYPMLIEDGGTTDLSTASGEIGIMRNGVAMYSAWANNPVEEYEDTAFYQTSGGFDPCGGHGSSSGAYHYHNTAGCLQEQAGGVVGEHSPLLGWAFDGFPLYGQLGPGGVEMKMCGASGADATHCLDLCSGYEAWIDEDTFAYRYYTSCGSDESFFPFTTNCFRGCCPTGVSCNSQVEACGAGAEIGYSEDHVPVAFPSLHDMYDTELIEGDDVDWVGSDFNVDCSLYLGAGSVAANMSAGGVGTTPSPSSVTASSAGPPVAAGPGETEPPLPDPVTSVTPSPRATSSPTSVSTVGTAPSPTSPGSPLTGAPEATGAGDTESPIPLAGDLPASTPSPGSATNDAAGDDDETSGASGAFDYVRVALPYAITAAAAGAAAVLSL